ncbi:MAG: tetratricopeptide repeat protein [Candidatus Sulfobium sp.]
MDKEETGTAGEALKRLRNRLIMLVFLLSLAVASCAVPHIIVLHDPLSPEEHVNLGLAYEKKGETRNAIREYTQAAKELPAAYVYLGNICYSVGAYAESERYYRTAIEKKPDLADAYNNLAWVLYTRGGDLREALRLAQKALALNPSDPRYADTVDRIDRETEKGTAPAP